MQAKQIHIEPIQTLPRAGAAFLIITPVRDEEEYIESTIQTMIAQTVRPIEWVIVDDGSKDETGRIIDRYASQIPWIQAIHRTDRGFRKSGGGVIEAFYEGYKSVRSTDWDFIVKLDGDLTFGKDYFERIFERFRSNPRLGIAGGTIFNAISGTLKLENGPKFHVRGATKIYRRECWEAIEGLPVVTGWDTFDEVKANRLGWQSQTFPDLHLVQHRPTGEADGWWKDKVKNGRANYMCGYHPLFMMTKCVRRVIKKPYLIGAAGLFYGFVSGYMKRIPQVDDPETIKYLRRQQIGRLFGGETIWR